MDIEKLIKDYRAEKEEYMRDSLGSDAEKHIQEYNNLKKEMDSSENKKYYANLSIDQLLEPVILDKVPAGFVPELVFRKLNDSNISQDMGKYLDILNSITEDDKSNALNTKYINSIVTEKLDKLENDELEGFFKTYVMKLRNGWFTKKMKMFWNEDLSNKIWKNMLEKEKINQAYKMLFENIHIFLDQDMTKSNIEKVKRKYSQVKAFISVSLTKYAGNPTKEFYSSFDKAINAMKNQDYLFTFIEYARGKSANKDSSLKEFIKNAKGLNKKYTIKIGNMLADYAKNVEDTNLLDSLYYYAASIFIKYRRLWDFEKVAHYIEKKYAVLDDKARQNVAIKYEYGKRLEFTQENIDKVFSRGKKYKVPLFKNLK